MPKIDDMHSARTRKRCVNSCSRVAGYVKEFCLESTIGGMRHLVEDSRHPVEKLVWLIVILLAIFATVALIYGSWQRYKESPTVIAFDKEYRTWEIPIPAFTVCLPERVDKQKALQYINQNWPTIDANKTQYYLEFISMAANLSLKNMNGLKNFINDPTLANVDIEQLARKVQPEKKIKTIRPATKMFTYNEYGLCLCVDSLTESILQAGNNASAIVEPSKVNHRMTAYNKILIYNSIEAEFYVYSAYEVADVNMRPTTVDVNGIISYVFQPYISKASEDLRHLSMQQRHCRFHDEIKGTGLPVYSRNLCRMRCRVRLAKKLCGCAPPFYKFLGVRRLCNLTGLLCISRHSDELAYLKNPKGQSFDCYCFPTCNEITISLLGWKKTGTKKKTQIVNIAWMQQFPTTMYQRDVLFTFEDLLVSFGSTAGLFLGVSFLSGVELVYFFSLRLFFVLIRREKWKIEPVPRRRTRIEILNSFN